MNNKIIWVVLFFIIVAGAVYTIQDRKNGGVVEDYKNAEYMIDGKLVKLHNGISEVEIAPGSASRIVTEYFGNELKTDLDGDGREDVAFILTQNAGGSGTFYYAVAALNTEKGYVGSDGFLLGDRIAPQPTTLSQNPRHKQVVAFNYAERAPGDPMTAQPSIGKSVYLKLDLTTRQWGIVEPDFEGESTVSLVSRDSEAVALVKKLHPTFADYPSSGLPPKSVEVIRVSSNWYVGMYVTGSGVSGIIRADCFKVTDRGEVSEVGFFQGEGPARSIHPATCTPKE